MFRRIDAIVILLLLLLPVSALSVEKQKECACACEGTKADTKGAEAAPVQPPAVSATPEAPTNEDGLHEVPPILDPDFRHRKKNQFEFYPYGGIYLGATVDQTYAVGARLTYHFNNTWAVGVNYSYSDLMTDRSSTFGQTITDDNMHILNAELVISNDAAIRAGKRLIEMDFYMTLGAGAIKLNETWEPAGLIGGGVKIYPGKPWFAFRVDVNNYAHMTTKPGDDPFDFDVEFIGGVSFLFPTNPSPYERSKSE